MENRTMGVFFFMIIGIISGRALIKKFDPDIFKFHEPLTSHIYVIYILGFLASILGLLMIYKNRNQK